MWNSCPSRSVSSAKWPAAFGETPAARADLDANGPLRARNCRQECSAIRAWTGAPACSPERAAQDRPEVRRRCPLTMRRNASESRDGDPSRAETRGPRGSMTSAAGLGSPHPWPSPFTVWWLCSGCAPGVLGCCAAADGIDGACCRDRSAPGWAQESRVGARHRSSGARRPPTRSAGREKPSLNRPHGPGVRRSAAQEGRLTRRRVPRVDHP